MRPFGVSGGPLGASGSGSRVSCGLLQVSGRLLAVSGILGVGGAEGSNCELELSIFGASWGHVGALFRPALLGPSWGFLGSSSGRYRDIKETG